MKNINYLVFFLAFLTILPIKTLCAQGGDTLSIYDIKPEFPGGPEAYDKYWADHFRIPKRLRKLQLEDVGKIKFIIDMSGRIQKAYIADSLHPELDSMALIAVKYMPRWIPAVKDGKAVSAHWEISYWYHRNFIEKKNVRNPIPQRGLIYGLWTGPLVLNGDYGDYTPPFRWVLGLSLGYTYKRIQVWSEYDVSFSRKVEQSFMFDGENIEEGHRFSQFNAYIPLGFRFHLGKGWVFLPYVGASFNNIEITKTKQQASGTGLSLTEFSYVYGFRFYKIDFSTMDDGFEHQFVSTLGLLLQYNPVHFKKKNTTEMGGGFFSTSATITGLFFKQR